jgi:hypothetical protein
MDMHDGKTSWTSIMDMQHEYAACIYSDKQYELPA